MIVERFVFHSGWIRFLLV